MTQVKGRLAGTNDAISLDGVGTGSAGDGESGVVENRTNLDGPQERLVGMWTVSIHGVG
jgi:hypothetical protein